MTPLYPARWRTLIMFAAAACGAAIGLVGLTSSAARWPFLLLTILFAPLSILYLKRLIFRRPVIAIGNEGLEVPAKGLLRWEEVAAIYPYNIGDYSYLGIVSRRTIAPQGLRSLALKMDRWKTGKELWHSFTLEELSFKDSSRLHELLAHHRAPVHEPIDTGPSRRQTRQALWRGRGRRII